MNTVANAFAPQPLRARVRVQIFLAQVAAIDVGVNLRGGDVGMPQDVLDDAQVRPALQHMRGERMAQRVRMQVVHAIVTRVSPRM